MVPASEEETRVWNAWNTGEDVIRISQWPSQIAKAWIGQTRLHGSLRFLTFCYFIQQNVNEWQAAMWMVRHVPYVDMQAEINGWITMSHETGHIRTSSGEDPPAP